MPNEERNRTRLDYTAHARIIAKNKKSSKALVRDISLESVYLHCRPDVTIGEEVNLEITLLGTNSELVIKVPAETVRIDKEGAAFDFLQTLEWWPIFTYFPLKRLDKTALSLHMLNN